MKYPELYPMSDEDVEMLYECLGLAPEDLEDIKNNEPTRFDNLTKLGYDDFSRKPH